MQQQRDSRGQSAQFRSLQFEQIGTRRRRLLVSRLYFAGARADLPEPSEVCRSFRGGDCAPLSTSIHFYVVFSVAALLFASKSIVSGESLKRAARARNKTPIGRLSLECTIL